MVLLLQTHKSHISTFATSRERCERATAELLAASPRAASPAKESQYLGADAWRPKTSNNKQNMWHSKHHLNVFYMFNPLWDGNILYPEPQSNNRNIRNIYIYIYPNVNAFIHVFGSTVSQDKQSWVKVWVEIMFVTLDHCSRISITMFSHHCWEECKSVINRSYFTCPIFSYLFISFPDFLVINV